MESRLWLPSIGATGNPSSQSPKCFSTLTGASAAIHYCDSLVFGMSRPAMEYIKSPESTHMAQSAPCTPELLEAYSCKNTKRDKKLFKSPKHAYNDELSHPPPLRSTVNLKKPHSAPCTSVPPTRPLPSHSNTQHRLSSALVESEGSGDVTATGAAMTAFSSGDVLGGFPESWDEEPWS